MHLKVRRVAPVLALCALIQALPVQAKEGRVYSPRVGTRERTAILHALRQPVLKFNKIRYVTFTGVKMRVLGNWAYVDARTVDSRGRRVGPDFTNELAGLLQKNKGTWKVVRWAYATDVISMGWEQELPNVPKKVWPHTR